MKKYFTKNTIYICEKEIKMYKINKMSRKTI